MPEENGITNGVTGENGDRKLAVTLEGAILALLLNYHVKWDKEHSVNYTLEDCLLAGIEAKRRSKEYSEDTRNRKEFEKAIAADPTVITRPEDLQRLMTKYKFGVSKG